MMTKPGNVLAAPDAKPPAPALTISRFAENGLTVAIDRHRRWVYASCALLLLLAFNGQWRIGLDSANYRGLADSLANGRGFTFGTWAPKAIYPGLPLMLAALQKLFGTSVFMPCICLNLMAAATLFLTSALVRLQYPRWVAVSVIGLIGVNSWFLELANEILTDMPFLLGVMIALYGWERMRLNADGRIRFQWPAMFLTGLALAGVMRPTFWIVIVAWGLVSVWGLIRGPRRPSFISLTMLAAILLAFVIFDPRARGFNPFKGLPEQQAINLLTEGPETVRVLNNAPHEPVPTNPLQIIWQKTRYILHDQLPSAFYGQRVAPLSILASLILLASALLLWRHPLWMVLIYLTFIVTALLSAEPRYYIMVLPLLALGWVLMIERLLRFAPGGWGTMLACGLLLLVVGNNIARDVPIILEQRARPFLEHYRKGEYLPLIALAGEIRNRLPEDAEVLGPSGSVLSYLSGRHVWTQRELLWHVHEIDYPQRVADMHFTAAVFPARLYTDKEPIIARLMAKRIIVAPHILFTGDKLSLATVDVRVPATDWRKLPRPKPKVVHPPKRKKKKSPRPALRRPNKNASYFSV